MKELAILLASVMSREQIIEQLEKELEGYKSAPNEDNWAKLTSIASLMMMKSVTEAEGDGDSMKGMSKTIDRMNKAEKGAKLMKAFDSDGEKNG